MERSQSKELWAAGALYEPYVGLEPVRSQRAAKVAVAPGAKRLVGRGLWYGTQVILEDGFRLTNTVRPLNRPREDGCREEPS